ncbi:MAG: DUF2877 domain-containing protein [Hadesarchaea archaeon]|nr:DUF2877 domain-containing protein [Hadesarchaea archaeon]
MSRSVKALQIGLTANKIINQVETGEIHSIFDRTFNLILEDNLVGIAQKDVTQTPINIVTSISSKESMSSLGLKKGKRVKVIEDQIIIRNVLNISLEEAVIWRPRTRVESHLDFDSIRRNVDLAKRVSKRKIKTDGLGQLLNSLESILVGEEINSNDLNRVTEKAIPSITQLVRGVRENDLRIVKSSARKLIGLGPGLSPSADDMLSGFMLAKWWIANSLDKRNVNRVRELNEAITDSKDRTTLVSQQLLVHGARGETNKAIEEFLEAILSGNKSSIESSVERVMSIGETSGVDTMLGLLMGLELSLD